MKSFSGSVASRLIPRSVSRDFSRLLRNFGCDSRRIGTFIKRSVEAPAKLRDTSRRGLTSQTPLHLAVHLTGADVLLAGVIVLFNATRRSANTLRIRDRAASFSNEIRQAPRCCTMRVSSGH